MKKELEDYLYAKIPAAGESARVVVRETIGDMVCKGMINSPKQAWRTLEKWADKGIYEYGISLDLGWKTNKVK